MGQLTPVSPTHKIPKYSDTQKFVVIILKFERSSPKDAHRTLIWVYTVCPCLFVRKWKSRWILKIWTSLWFIKQLNLVMRKPVFAICEQQRRRSTCASSQSDKRLCFSLPMWYTSSSFYIRNFKPLASFCGCAGRFVSYLVGNPEERFSRNEAQFILPITCRFFLRESFANVKTKPRLLIRHMSRDRTKPTKWLCAQRRLRSVWTESSLCAQWIAKYPGWAFCMRTAKNLIRSETSLGAHSICWFCHVAAHMV